MAELQARDLKLIQYLNEAYGTERRLETALEAHIVMTTRAPYKRRLQQHLRETKGHARAVERRIKQLGGKAETVSVPGPERVTGAAQAVLTAGQKAAAAAQGPLHAARGTGEQERLLRNARTEIQNESEEIATYTAIVTLADTVGDRETSKLAKGILREEERMRGYLEKLIPQLTKAVAQEEIPARERRRNGGRRRRSTSRSTSRSRSRASGGRSRTRSSSARSGGRSTSRSTRSGGRSTSRPSSGRRSSSARSGARKSTSRSTSARSGARQSTGRSTSSRSGGRSSTRRTGGSRSTRRKS